MKTRALRWWSHAALDEAVRVVDAGWSDWCANWNVARGAVSATNACEASAFDEAAPTWQALDGAGGAMWWAVSGAAPTAGVRELLFGAARQRAAVPLAPRVPSIADEIATRAVADLQRCLSMALQPEARNDAPARVADETTARHVTEHDDRPVPLPPVPLPPVPAKPWSGDLRVRLESPQHRGIHIDLFIAAWRAERLFGTPVRPTPASMAAPLARTRDAIRTQLLQLRVELSGVALDLATLQSLRIGDVLPLPHRLDEALHLHTAPGAIDGRPRRVGSAHLGSRDGQRAVELTRDPVQA